MAQLKNVAKASEELVDRLLKEFFPPRQPQKKQITGWKQTKNGRYYNVLLHDEETGIAVEQMAEAEKVSRQKIIVEAVALRKQHLQKSSKFDAVVELERYKSQGKISDFTSSEGIWLITLNDHQLEPVTPQGLQMFLRHLAA